jgi:hypothetical protein
MDTKAVSLPDVLDKLRATPATSEQSIPLDYILSGSETTLKTFALTRLTTAANLRKEARAIEREAQNNELAGQLAAFLAEHRREILAAAAERLASAHPELCSPRRSIDSLKTTSLRGSASSVANADPDPRTRKRAGSSRRSARSLRPLRSSSKPSTNGNL